MNLKNLFKRKEITKPQVSKDSIGDGKAEFIGEGTEKEFKDYENEGKGIKGIFGIK